MKLVSTISGYLWINDLNLTFTHHGQVLESPDELAFMSRDLRNAIDRGWVRVLPRADSPKAAKVKARIEPPPLQNGNGIQAELREIKDLLKQMVERPPQPQVIEKVIERVERVVQTTDGKAPTASPEAAGGVDPALMVEIARQGVETVTNAYVVGEEVKGNTVTPDMLEELKKMREGKPTP